MFFKVKSLTQKPTFILQSQGSQIKKSKAYETEGTKWRAIAFVAHYMCSCVDPRPPSYANRELIYWKRNNIWNWRFEEGNISRHYLDENMAMFDSLTILPWQASYLLSICQKLQLGNIQMHASEFLSLLLIFSSFPTLGLVLYLTQF